MPLKQKNLKITINYLYKIITQNNIKFGRSQYLINNSANLFVFRIKNNMEFFDIIDLKNILYKIFLYVKTLYLINKKSNNFLFATTTPVFSEIMKNAAFSSNTIYHIDRWTCGTITRRIDKWHQSDYINVTHFKKQKNIFNFCFFFWKYKKSLREASAKNPLIGLFIPDIQNNLMIIKEAKIENIPLIGIINSYSFIDVNYPIFGNSRSLFAVFFFSNLVAHWISIHMRFANEKKGASVKRKINNNKKLLKNLQKTNSYWLLQQRYIYMIYKFRKSFQNELLYNAFIEGADSTNLDDYKNKLKVQKKKRILMNNVIFSSTNVWNLKTRWIVLTKTIQANLTGGLSFTSNFLGQHFWLYFRNNLINPGKTKKRNRFSKLFKWFLKHKRNWRWLKYNKKKLIKNSKFFKHKKKIIITNIRTKYPKKSKINNYNRKGYKRLNMSLEKHNEKNKYNKKITK